MNSRRVGAALLAIALTAVPGADALAQVEPAVPVARWRGWDLLGPHGATVNEILYHPGIGGLGLVYLGSDEGLFYSANGGTAWERLLDSGAGTIRVDPFNPGTMLAAAGDSGSMTKLKRSTDFGETWSTVFALPDAHHSITCLTFDPARRGVVYLCSSYTVQAYRSASFHRSLDAGLTWNLVFWEETPDLDSFHDIIVHPSDGTILAAVESAFYSVIESADGGATWSDAGGGLGTLDSGDLEWFYPDVAGLAAPDGIYIHSHGSDWWFRLANELEGLPCSALARGPAENIWYALAGGLNEAGVVYRSEDYGITWERRSDVAGHEWVCCLAADPHAAPGTETILAGTFATGVFASLDLAATWQTRNQGLSGIECASVAFGPPGSGLVFAGGTHQLFFPGLYRSRDLGRTWEVANHGLPAYGFSSICTHPSNDQVVFATRSWGELYRSSDQGESWHRLENGLPQTGPFYTVAATPAGTLLAGHEDGLFRSDDGGDSWFSCNTGMNGKGVQDVACVPDDPAHVFAALWLGPQEGVYESADGGLTWSAVLTGPGAAYSVAAAPGGARVFAGVDGWDLYRSLDGGDSWTKLPVQARTSVVVAGSEPLTVACGGIDDVWISQQGGNGWFTLPGLPGGLLFDVNDLAVPPPGTPGEVLYTATSGGVYRVRVR